MSNEKRAILIVGAMIVAALWVRAIAEYVYLTSDVAEVTSAEVVESQYVLPENSHAAVPALDELDKICTDTEGAIVDCLAVTEETICIQTLGGAQSGFRVDCKSDQPIPLDDGTARQGGAKYRSPW